MTSLGTPSKPLAFEGEQLMLDETANPTSTEGRMYVDSRTPPGKSADVISLVFIEIDGSETVVYGYPRDFSGSEVLEIVRSYDLGLNLNVFFPVTTPDKAAYPHLRVRHNGTTYAFHDKPEVSSGGSDIPDSVLFQYDFRQEDGTLPVIDKAGNEDLDGGGYSSVNRTINGNQAGDFQKGSNDRASTTLASSISYPIWVYAVVKWDNVGSQGGIWSTHDSNNIERIKIDGNDWRYRGNGPNLGWGATDTNPHILSFQLGYNDNWIFRADGKERSTTSNSKSISIPSGERMDIGFSQDDTGTFDGAIGFVEIHNSEPSAGLVGREDEIATDWGFNL